LGRSMSERVPDNPVLVEVTRGALVESYHRGAIAVADAGGGLVFALGDVARPVFPRSAIKLLQAIPLIESGAADAFGLGKEELAVACASHSGEAIHVAAVRSLLAKAGLDEGQLACGAQWPLSEHATRELVRAGARPQPIHNNCSGKHAGMLATAIHLGLAPSDYERSEHPIQGAIARVISEACDVRLEPAHMGIDGCSVPNWGLPLRALARAFARIVSGQGLPPVRGAAAERLVQACFAAPVLIAGAECFDTIVMGARAAHAFVKGGAEGVHCAALPELRVGIALKIDDGAKRAAETVLAELLAVLVPTLKSTLADQLKGDIRNWRGLSVGRLRASAALKDAIADSDSLPRHCPNRVAR
jgi:L-asparaginase II